MEELKTTLLNCIKLLKDIVKNYKVDIDKCNTLLTEFERELNEKYPVKINFWNYETSYVLKKIDKKYYLELQEEFLKDYDYRNSISFYKMFGDYDYLINKIIDIDNYTEIQLDILLDDCLFLLEQFLEYMPTKTKKQLRSKHKWTQEMNII